MKKITTEINIEASPETVWDILMDFAAYPDWNPFITSISGEPVVGATIETHLQPVGGKGMGFRPGVTAVDSGKRFEWLGKLGIHGIFDGRHQFRIEAASDGTKFIHSEEFTGLLVPLLSRSLDKGTKAGFEAMNEALKLRAEGIRSR